MTLLPVMLALEAASPPTARTTSDAYLQCAVNKTIGPASTKETADQIADEAVKACEPLVSIAAQYSIAESDAARAAKARREVVAFRLDPILKILRDGARNLSLQVTGKIRSGKVN